MNFRYDLIAYFWLASQLVATFGSSRNIVISTCEAEHTGMNIPDDNDVSCIHCSNTQLIEILSMIFTDG